MPKLSLSAIAAIFGLVVTTAACAQSAPNQIAPTPVLAVTSVSPNHGLTGTSVTISGSGFAPGAIAIFGGLRASVESISQASITARVSVEAIGPIDVVVRNPSGELATLTRGFTVTGIPVIEEIKVTLTASLTTVAPGGQLSVTWAASGQRSILDWIGLFRIATPSISYEDGWWQYTNGIASGTATLVAPTAPGQYEFRYLLDDGFHDVARSSPITVE